MSSSSSSRACAALAGGALLVAALARRRRGPARRRALRPEIGKPLQAAQELIKARRYAKRSPRCARPRRSARATPTRPILIERMRMAAASGAGDADTAARSFEALERLGPHLRGRQAAHDRVDRRQLLPRPAVRQGDAMEPALLQAKAARARAIRTMLIQSQYLSGDFAGASKELMAEIQAAERAGQRAARRPAEAAAQRGDRSRATTTPTSSRWRSSSPTTRRRSTGSTC